MIPCTAPPSWYWKLESTLLVIWRQRCVQAGHWTVHTQLIFLHDQKMFKVHFQDCIGHCACTKACKHVICSSRRTCCSFQSCISDSERQRSRFAPCESTRDSLMHHCHILAVAGSRIAERSTSTMSVCKLRNNFHELHFSCHRNSCPELVFLSSLSCKSCLHSSDA